MPLLLETWLRRLAASATHLVSCLGASAALAAGPAGTGDASPTLDCKSAPTQRMKAAIRAMVAGNRMLVPGLFNKMSIFGVRFLTRRFASKVATQVLGKPDLALPARIAN